jgi:hypothetical protein
VPSAPPPDPMADCNQGTCLRKACLSDYTSDPGDPKKQTRKKFAKRSQISVNGIFINSLAKDGGLSSMAQV